MTKFLFAAATAAAVLAFDPAVAQIAPPPGVSQGTAPVATAPTGPRVQRHVFRMPMKIKTRDQVVAHSREMFARLDTNKDGFVTRAEADAAHQAMGGEIRQKFAKRFADGGMRHPDRGAMFDKLDANKDGSISRQEFMSASRHVRERRAIAMRGGERPVGMRMRGKMFERADGNRDGKVSLQEMTNAALRHFDGADANHDGKLTPDERMKMHLRADLHRIQRS
jgi:Ca2+-binding EF-hand superfamily protein